MNTFAIRCKELRTDKNISQQTLSEILSVTQQTISKWEKGLREPDIDTLIKIAEIFGCSVDYLIGYKDF
ncbi:MAG: helix-turn-helix transcriptional regulator [Clostridia bacterium]|nr:helix-turn-helix transcriptional regulator [Clostridia bacterium]